MSGGDFVVIDCACGRRYGRTMCPTLAARVGQARCVCGGLLGDWSGRFNLVFEAEDASAPAVTTELRAC